MHVTMAGVIALEQLRMQLEEDAGADYPHDVRTELLMLYDVCSRLNMGLFYMQDVLGDKGWAYVQAEIDKPVGLPTAQALLAIGVSPVRHNGAHIH